MPIDVQISKTYIDILLNFLVIKHKRSCGLLSQSEKYGYDCSVSKEHEIISFFQIIQTDLTKLGVILFQMPLFEDHQNEHAH